MHHIKVCVCVGGAVFVCVHVHVNLLIQAYSELDVETVCSQLK